jgi:hypothetical protein
MKKFATIFIVAIAMPFIIASYSTASAANYKVRKITQTLIPERPAAPNLV